MKNVWVRSGIAAVLLFVMVAGVSALAKPDPLKMDTSKCGSLRHGWNDVCRTTCEDSVYTIGLCRNDKTGETWLISVECCCCTEGWNHRSFIGG